ncbi:hypothetical protein GGD41_003149 [Paraburkholderia bryophila]|uniref:Uncharacterized protein n=1 Tax=Paraburkholderia bryophila TaxID=420952 RepID=A0A7Z0AZQ2_9BURK|nr:hypothetical protein [Paraburkholderia bryophila]
MTSSKAEKTQPAANADRPSREEAEAAVRVLLRWGRRRSGA